MLGQRFSEALAYASQLHQGQVRKASQVPYVSHLLAVTATVLEYGGDEDTAIAALLHDAVEDCGGQETARQIANRFGARVRDIVLGCSDTDCFPKPPWRERKEGYLAHLPNAPLSVHLICAADKLHNLTSLLRDLRQQGSSIWSRFRSGKEGALWYYGRVVEILKGTPLAPDLVNQVEANYRKLLDMVESPR